MRYCLMKMAISLIATKIHDAMLGCLAPARQLLCRCDESSRQVAPS